MTTTKKLLTIALAASTLAVGSIAASGDALAKGGKGGWKGGWKGGHHHKWHGHRWHGRHYFAKYYNYYEPCYFARTRSGRVIKVCPDELF